MGLAIASRIAVDELSQSTRTRRRLLRVGLKHYGGKELSRRLRVSDAEMVAWLEGREDIQPGKLLALIDLIEAKRALGEDF